MANGVTSESLLSVSIIFCCVSNVILLDYNMKRDVRYWLVIHSLRDRSTCQMACE